MSDYLKVQAQIQKLQLRAERLKKQELAQIISRIKKAIKTYELTAADLGLTASSASGPGPRRGRPAKKAAAVTTGSRGRKGGRKAAKKVSGKAGMDKRSIVAPKYRDAATGATWTGRGKQPKWLAAAIANGKQLQDFKI